MDLDATLKKHDTRLGDIESFIEHIKGLMSGADGNVEKESDTLDQLVAFKSMFEGMLPQIEKTFMDVLTVTGDIDAIRKDLAPALAWIVEQQKTAEEAKAKVEAEEKLKAEAAVKAQPEEHKAAIETQSDPVAAHVEHAAEHAETEQAG